MKTISIIAILVLLGCGGGGGSDEPQIATEQPEIVAPTETQEPTAVIPEPEPIPEPAPVFVPDPVVVPVTPEPEIPTPPPANNPKPAPLPDYVFRYTFSGVVDFVELYNPLNAHFETYIGKRFYGVVNVDARNFYYDEEVGIYLIDNPTEDNYIEFFLEDMYFRAFVHALHSFTKTSLSLDTMDWYDYETIQLPDYLSTQNVTLDNFGLEMSYNDESGEASWGLYFHDPADPYADYIWGRGGIDTITQIQ